MPQISLQRVIQTGITDLKGNRTAFNEIFDIYTHDSMNDDYGQTYIDTIWDWFTEVRIPVVQAWAFNSTRIPGISVHLAQEMEDESKAAIGDHHHISFDDDMEIGIGVFTVNLDIGIHADKTGDEVLWLYYIVSYALFNQKRLAEDLGIKLQTFNGSDYGRKIDWIPENVWSRWIRFKCTVENMWGAAELFEADDIVLDIEAESTAGPPTVDITAPIRDEP